jgi:hypothetical protein
VYNSRRSTWKLYTNTCIVNCTQKTVLRVIHSQTTVGLRNKNVRKILVFESDASNSCEVNSWWLLFIHIVLYSYTVVQDQCSIVARYCCIVTSLPVYLSTIHGHCIVVIHSSKNSILHCTILKVDTVYYRYPTATAVAILFWGVAQFHWTRLRQRLRYWHCSSQSTVFLGVVSTPNVKKCPRIDRNPSNYHTKDIR